LLLKNIKPDSQRIKSHYDSFLCATDLVDYLSAKGVPFREAHGIIGKLVSYAEKNKVTLSALKLKEFQRFSCLFALDVFEVFDPGHSIRLKKTSGSTNPEAVQIQIKRAKKLIGR
jgi:argininosuccinate lyase